MGDDDAIRPEVQLARAILGMPPDSVIHGCAVMLVYVEPGGEAESHVHAVSSVYCLTAPGAEGLVKTLVAEQKRVTDAITSTDWEDDD